MQTHTQTVDVLVIGGCIAGLQAALVAGASGARVIVLEQSAAWGGRAPVDGDLIEAVAAPFDDEEVSIAFDPGHVEMRVRRDQLRPFARAFDRRGAEPPWPARDPSWARRRRRPASPEDARGRPA